MIVTFSFSSLHIAFFDASKHAGVYECYEVYSFFKIDLFVLVVGFFADAFRFVR